MTMKGSIVPELMINQQGFSSHCSLNWIVRPYLGMISLLKAMIPRARENRVLSWLNSPRLIAWWSPWFLQLHKVDIALRKTSEWELQQKCQKHVPHGRWKNTSSYPLVIFQDGFCWWYIYNIKINMIPLYPLVFLKKKIYLPVCYWKWLSRNSGFFPLTKWWF